MVVVMKAFLFLVSLLMAVPAYALTIDEMSDSEADDLERGIEAMEKKEYATARHKFLPLAIKGNPSAQLYIGVMFLLGNGLNTDACEGVKWIDRAAREGDTDAQMMMASILSDVSWGHRPDYHRSYGWLITAIQNGATDIKKKAYVLTPNIQDLFKVLDEKLTKVEMLKIKNEVTDGRFDIKTPANEYIVRIREYHVGEHVIPIAPCTRLYPD
ncbi:hypothetical protein RYZ26_15095 [Terasakiella sp. A23]|uniref:tetratricopeptide repeat protein n=1 Tax=Terasakiella sp. FCG-A23 TaxID=3080561 RepID=UPI002955497D|nr:hypothetical protein [Terasakiella sp. A23]MDV7340932.1 hypothetical protein [Terasakiella sp. A23]